MARHTFTAIVLTIVVGFAPVAGKEPEPLTFSSGERQVVLIELFTSEGCSSCPPADNWLSDLQDEAGIWSDFVPIAFHVDYWDYIGWRDRFAKPEFSTRQRRYADEGSASIVYTPGFFWSGREWRGWFHGKLLPASRSVVGNLSIEVGEQEVSARFEPEQEVEGSLAIHVALIGMNLESRVNAGENVGKTLRHNFVVLKTGTARMHKARDTYSGQLKLSKSDVDATATAIVAWVSPRNRQMPIQATGGFLR